MKEASIEDNLDKKTSSKIEEESNASKNHDIDDELDSSKWKQELVKFIAIEATTTYIIIVINYQRPLECNREGCDEIAYYRHSIFDSEISLREFVRKIRINFYQNKECRYIEKIYTH